MRAALDEIRSDPTAGNDLQLELTGYRSLRVGRLRIVYRTGATTEVIAIGPRETIYQDAARLLRPMAERRTPYTRRGAAARRFPLERKRAAARAI
ncbi:MAG: type II toxin-antitoxin system RelE/ParE family toxin [Chloroflexi bacterium]|nr:type II toxin-antitoxin system RelE/ParE family toxin [Chloroflexota bacterium]